MSQSDPRFLAQHLSGFHWIDGELRSSLSGKTFPVIHSATQEIIGHAADGNAADVEQAVQAAKRAQPAWAKMPARERGKLLLKIADHLEAHQEELAQLMTLETAKAIRTESRMEAGIFVDLLRYYGGLASEIKGDTFPLRPGVFSCTLREPIGVVGAVIAWNVPLFLMAMKMAPALAAGNTVVLKSAEEAPFTVLYVAELLKDLLPKGVLNVLSGDGPQCGAPLVSHPDIGKVSFTGSVSTGRCIYKMAAERLIPVTLELGGKSPMIVMPDADLSKALDGAFTGMRFTRQGQSCTAASRMYIHESIYEIFLEGLKARLDPLVIGDPFDEATDIGAIISPGQYTRIGSFLEETQADKQTRIIRCSQLPQDKRLQKGLFLQPTLLANLPADARAIREEIFGPVTCLVPFKDYEEAIALANDTNYGLAAAIWTQNLKTAMDAVGRLEAGFVQVNQYNVAQASTPFGGYKHSGLGKEASLDAMLNHYTREKTVLINLE